MKLVSTLSDDLVLAELGQRLGRQRLALGLTQAELAEQAGVAKRTLERVESGGGTQLITWIRLLRVMGLIEHLDQLVPKQEISPMTLLKEAKKGAGEAKRRHRATGNKHTKQIKIEKNSQKTWTWGKDS